MDNYWPDAPIHGRLIRSKRDLGRPDQRHSGRTDSRAGALIPGGGDAAAPAGRRGLS